MIRRRVWRPFAGNPVRPTDHIVFDWIHQVDTYRMLSTIARTMASAAVSRQIPSIARSHLFARGSVRPVSGTSTALKSYVSETRGEPDTFEFRVFNYTGGDKVRKKSWRWD